jgi:type IX secretion system PorP/SprF family membrane protein
MKTRLLFLALFLFASVMSFGQDIPLFSQKLTNSFLYNPAMAGLSSGSLTLSHRTNYAGVQGAPVDNFLSFQTPVSNGRFGFGVNALQDRVNILDNTFASAAFAYHLQLNSLNRISMGLGAEYNMTKLNDLTLVTDDAVLQRYNTGTGKPDFSFGLVYETRLFRAGLAANRLSSGLFQSKGTQTISNYYTAFLQGTLPMRGGADLIEPYVNFRKFSESNSTIDIGAYYTYNSKLLAGVAVRNGSTYSGTVGFHFTKNIMAGYSREMNLGPVGGFVGSTNEITFRFDFSQKETPKKFNNDYRSSLSYRRKTLNTSGVKKTAGGHTPKQLSKAQKRVAAFSPNRRYQNVSKLSSGRKKSYPKKRAPARRKPARRR